MTRSRLIGIIRRVALIVSVAVLVIAVVMFFSAQVGEEQHGTVEVINGQANTSALLLPLVLFIVGAAGLIAALGWRPRRDGEAD